MKKIAVIISFVAAIANCCFIPLSNSNRNSNLELENVEFVAEANEFWPELILVVGSAYLYYKSKQHGTVWRSHGAIETEDGTYYDWECIDVEGTSEIKCQPVGRHTYPPYSYIDPNQM